MIWKFASINAFAIILGGCALAQETVWPEKDFLVVAGAQNVREHRAFNGGRLQIIYSVNLKYPSLSVGEPQRRQLREHGWIKCSTGESGWDSYLDGRSDIDRMMDHHTTFWAKNNQLLTISLRYNSQSKRPRIYNKPDNQIQNVVILFDRYDDTKIFKTVKKRLELSCSSQGQTP